MLDRFDADAERLIFFKMGGDTRKVTLKEPLRSMEELNRMFTNKFRDAEFGGDIEFWSKDQKFGVRFKISSADEIYNGAVLEVITPAKKDKVPITEVRRGPDGRADAFSNKGSRPSVPISDVMLCSVHKKRRTLMNLMKDDDDNWVCVPDSVCKTGSSNNTREQTCSIHGKVRTLSNLQKKNGEWVCLQRAQCKAGMKTGFGVEQRPSYFSSFRSPNGQFVPLSERGGFRPSNGQLGPLSQRGGYQGGRDDWPSNKTGFAQICSLHGKERSMNNLINDGGRWVCDPAFECKGFGPIAREPLPIVREPRPIIREPRPIIREPEQMGRPRFRDNFDGNLRPGYDLYRRALDPPDSPQRYRSTHDPPFRQDPDYGRFSPREREYSPGFEPRRDDFGLLGRRRDFPGPGFGPRRDDFGIPARRREVPFPRRGGNGPRNSGLICRIHGKYRSRGNMMSTKNGAWECLPSSECK